MFKRSIFVAALLSATVGSAFAEGPIATGEAYGQNSSFVSQRTRAEVQAEAVAAAKAPNQNIDVSAYVNSQLPVGLNGEAATRQAAADSRAPL